MIGGLLLSAYNYELGHWGVFYYFKKLTAGLQESSWRRNTKVRLTIYGKGGRVQGEEMVSGKNIWGRKGKLTFVFLRQLDSCSPAVNFLK